MHNKYRAKLGVRKYFCFASSSVIYVRVNCITTEIFIESVNGNKNKN